MKNRRYCTIGSIGTLLFGLALASAGCSDETPKLVHVKLAGALMPTTLDFREVPIDGSKSLEVALVNTGGGTLVVQGFTSERPFTLRVPKGSHVEGLQVAPTSSVALEAVFLPSALGPTAGSIEIDVDGIDPLTLMLRGTGVVKPAPILALTPTVAIFGAVRIGSEGRATVHVANRGNAAGVIDAATMRSTGTRAASPFAVTSTLPLPIAPGMSAPIDLVFRPDRVGAEVDRIDLATNAGAMLSVQVSGQGLPAQGGLACTPSRIDFGPIKRGGTATQSIACTASGVLHFSSATLSGVSSTLPIFTLPSPPAPADLAMGETIRFPIVFAASGPAKMYDATVTLAYEGDSGATSVSVPLSGTVAPPDIDSTAISIVLRWQSSHTDFDLHLIRPGGMAFAASSDCYFADPAPDWGALRDPADDPYLDLDATDGPGVENINMSKAAAGTYDVYVHYYSDNGLGASDASADVYAGGSRLGTFSKSMMTCNQLWHVGTISWNGTAGSFSPSTQLTTVTFGACH
jgi:HYDIN/CFA65/VesB family protein